MFLEGQLRPHSKAQGASVPKFLGPHTSARSIRNNNQTVLVQTRCGEHFTGSTTNADARSVCCS